MSTQLHGLPLPYVHLVTEDKSADAEQELPLDYPPVSRLLKAYQVDLTSSPPTTRELAVVTTNPGAYEIQMLTQKKFRCGSSITAPQLLILICIID
jgi:hypothetical protein